jgi:hypothetical protein
MGVAIQWGNGCKHDQDGKCIDEPSEISPIILNGFVCEECGGRDELILNCKSCRGTGKIRFESCLLKIITVDIWELLDAVEFADKGNLPISGGFLDQTESFMEGLKLVRRLNAKMKANNIKG